MIFTKKLFVVTLVCFVTMNLSAQQNNSLIKSALQQLGLTKSKVKSNLIATKQFGNSPLYVVIIPEIEAKDPGYFLLSGHYLIMNSNTKEIESIYHEKDCWASDELQLKSININTDLLLNNDIKAFSVEVAYEGPKNQHQELKVTNSIFIQQYFDIRRVMEPYEVVSKRGKLNQECKGHITETYNELTISDQKSRGFNNLILRTKLIKKKYDYNKENKCVPVLTESNKKSVFKYNRQRYEQ